MTRIRRSIAAVALTTLALALLSGCSNGAEQRLNLLQQENQELRSRTQRLRESLNNAEQNRNETESELRALRAEKRQLEMELEQAQQQPDTGFEGLEGVDATRLSSGEVVVDVAGDVLFDSGQASLKSAAKQSLQEIARTINNRYAGRMIRIEGHTDTDPIRKSDWRNNEQLSAERALAVEDFLAEQGVDKDRMFIAAYGPSEPRGTKKESRRVEIVVLNASAS